MSVIGSTNGSKSASQVGSNAGSLGGSLTHSRAGSAGGSRKGSYEALPQVKEMQSPNKLNLNTGLRSLMNDRATEEDEEEEEEVDTNINMPRSIAQLMTRQRKEANTLAAEIKKETNDCKVAFGAKLDELLEGQKRDMESLITEQERLLKEMKEVQEKEILFEETMTANEMKMLIERRLLNSVLQTVSDGIISISPIGTLIRFNHAAEVIFGYKASEVLGKNIRDLVPNEHTALHDGYLKAYLTTGIKKVIGIGRTLEGKRKDGSLVPVKLSVGEVKERGEHMFTGIVHDLSEEVRVKNLQKEKDLIKQKELEDFVSMLNTENTRCSNLLSQILPPAVSKQLLNGKKVVPEEFDSVTILYFDIVGYTKISSQVAPTEIVALLNSLYNGIDSVIAQYDAYKVETVGDCFMIASGAPKKNKNHALEITKMALHLIATVASFVYAPKPEIKINIRLGIHSGMVVGGVVGDKMPRYCLFGETVQIASKMESGGSCTIFLT